VVVVRPYRHRLEQVLSVINCGILVGIALCGVWTRLSNDTDGTGTATLALGYLVLSANAFYFVQLIVLAAVTGRAHCRRSAPACVDAGVACGGHYQPTTTGCETNETGATTHYASLVRPLLLVPDRLTNEASCVSARHSSHLDHGEIQPKLRSETRPASPSIVTRRATSSEDL
jgi:hypothetical protein